MVDEITEETIAPTEKLVRNGWFVNSKGEVYVIINGSAYWTDATTKLSMGSYDEDGRRVDDSIAELSRERAERWLREKYHGENPDERDELGQFAPKGTGAAAAEEMPTAAPAVSTRLQVNAAKGVSAQTIKAVNAAIAAIPAKHAELLKNVPVNIKETTDDVRIRGASGLYSRELRLIEIPEKARTSLVGFDGIKRNVDVPIRSRERTTVHELGHAYNHHLKDQASFAIASRQNRGASPSMIDQGVGRLTRKEKLDARHYLSNSSETFAELYALAYSPDESAKYFGGMNRKRANEVFKEALAKVKSL